MSVDGGGTSKWYRSRDGARLFKFSFVQEGDHIAVYCLVHPDLGHQDPDSHKTHIFSSGRLCFVEGREPRDQAHAERLAQQWAEYFVEYRRTGIAQF